MTQPLFEILLLLALSHSRTEKNHCQAHWLQRNSFLKQAQTPHQQETFHLYFFSICKEPYQTQPMGYSGRNVHSAQSQYLP
ncbi:hypothetical protein, partial [Shigella flexneri]|uniref:hypothetical protein n=1 Tax=Shigella flexneri TaxID=623 RepID=UPI001C0A928F